MTKTKLSSEEEFKELALDCETSNLSKVEESWKEYVQAKKQGNTILRLVKLCDMYSSLFKWVDTNDIDFNDLYRNAIFELIATEAKKLGVTLNDIQIFYK